MRKCQSNPNCGTFWLKQQQQQTGRYLEVLRSWKTKQQQQKKIELLYKIGGNKGDMTIKWNVESLDSRTEKGH